jgi:hypothetical protein
MERENMEADLVYSKMVLGKEVVAYPTVFNLAIQKLMLDFDYGVCTWGIVFNYNTGKAYVVVDSEKFDEYRETWEVIEVDREEMCIYE